MRRHVAELEASTKARFEAAPKDGKTRRFKEFYDGAASWSRVERIIARVEVGEDGPDTRFIVSNLEKSNARALYEDYYCRRGQAENHIKSWKTHLAADRTSCTRAAANQFRLFLHAGAYWLMWGYRLSMPKRSMWRVAQFDTLRLRLIKIAARVVEMKSKVVMPRSGDHALRARENPAPRHMSDGAQRAPHQTLPLNPQTSPAKTQARSQRQRSTSKTQKTNPDHPKMALQVALTSRQCIMRASSRAIHFVDGVIFVSLLDAGGDLVGELLVGEALRR